ncbi:DUF6542 domain-containing protein [Nakamurella sp. PAMC28650]|jgi:hypothetical protein|uniref:DUF6542 domain-containing protein n=1 Tax=Nakamurella sp. PAMC28650 TaxID=2762325 RepID=UPI00351B0058
MPATRPTARPTAANASALPTITGLRSWGAVLVAVVLTAVGATFDGLVSGVLTWGFRVGFVAGVCLAALLVRRASIFTAMVQPPLVMVVLIFISLRLLSTERMTITLIKVVNAFPTMVIGTALAVLICVVRIFAQPLHRSKKTPAAQRAHV